MGHFYFKAIYFVNKNTGQINEYRISAWDDDNILEMAGGNGCTTLWT